MSTVRLSPLDAAWVFTEARATPNHVGGLLQFRLPDDAPKDFLRELMTEFRSHREFKAPWNRRMKFPVNVNPMPVWIEDDDIDLEYHVRHAALPWPGGAREAAVLHPPAAVPTKPSGSKAGAPGIKATKLKATKPKAAKPKAARPKTAQPKAAGRPAAARRRKRAAA